MNELRGRRQGQARQAVHDPLSGAKSTPTLIVNGKYKVTGKSFEDMLRIASG